ncbi:MAG: FAD-dependent oxidoreductase, partial [Methyloceanibacter sp.]
IRGCVPKKLLVYGSRYNREIEDARGYGWTCKGLRFDWPTLIYNVRREVDRLNGLYTRTLEAAGMDRFLTRAVVKSPHTVLLADREKPITSKVILVATGAHPAMPDVPGHQHLISSNECFQLEALPESIAIIGAGYIGMEFASIFAGLGVAVTVLYRGDQVLRGFDDDLRDGLADAMRNLGVDLRMDTNVASIEKEKDSYRVNLKEGGSISAALVMGATGRVPRTAGLGLQQIGVELGWNGQVVVDAFSKSSVDSIYAVGDVTDRANLTPAAIREANAFVETVFQDRPTPIDYTFVPTAVFSEPEIGTVGLTEAKARAMYNNIDIYKSSFRPLRATVSGRNERMLMKLVIDGATDKVLGCHILGPDAAEIVQMAAVPLMLGVTKAQLDATMALHPSVAEELVTMRHKWEHPAPIKGSDAAA